MISNRTNPPLSVRVEALEPEGLVISNPGGFAEGVSLENLLVVEPKPRNPRLADAMKRLGLAERTGRGVDLIYQGMLRYGRPAPDYSGSNPTGVVVRLSRVEADIPFLQMVLDEEARTGRPLPLDSLIALSKLRKERRIDSSALAVALQKPDSVARAVLEKLVESGLVEAQGTRPRVYTFSARVYRADSQASAYVRQAGFSALQQEQMVLQFTRSHRRIARKDAADLCRISEDQATRILNKLRKQNKLRKEGKGRATHYIPE